MNYICNYNGYEIPVTENERTNKIRLHAKWDLFCIDANPKYTKEQILEFLKTKECWMTNHISSYENTIQYLSETAKEEGYCLIHRSKYELRQLILKYTKKHENIRGKTNKISIRTNMKGKWASCSSKHNLTFNHIVGYLPDQLVEYIVYHELCHYTELEHDNKFYSLIREQFPNYEEQDNLLTTYHFLICHYEQAQIINKYKLEEPLLG